MNHEFIIKENINDKYLINNLLKLAITVMFQHPYIYIVLMAIQIIIIYIFSILLKYFSGPESHWENNINIVNFNTMHV